MSKISDAIRSAALGPAPDYPGDNTLYRWVGGGIEWDAAWDLHAPTRDKDFFHRHTSNDTRRTFLLIVAAALEDQT